MLEDVCVKRLCSFTRHQEGSTISTHRNSIQLAQSTPSRPQIQPILKYARHSRTQFEISKKNKNCGADGELIIIKLHKFVFICYMEIISCMLVSNFSDLVLHKFIQRFAWSSCAEVILYFEGNSFLGKQGSWFWSKSNDVFLISLWNLRKWHIFDR